MSFAIFAVARRARRRRRSDFPHSGDIRQQLLHALTTQTRCVLAALDGATRGQFHLQRCIQTNSSGLIFKRFDRCPMFGTTPCFSLPSFTSVLQLCSLLPFHFHPVHFLSSSNCAGRCSQGLAVHRILQWGCIVTESQLRTTPEQNTGAIRSLSQKYNALTFKKRWFLVGANTYCNDVHREKAPTAGSAAILASLPCRHDCASGEK
jgi:hypothetical protein